MSKRDPIEYLINAMESAAQSPRPFEQGYGDKRRAVLDAIVEMRKSRDELAEALRDAIRVIVDSDEEGLVEHSEQIAHWRALVDAK